MLLWIKTPKWVNFSTSTENIEKLKTIIEILGF
jgi:hypothetical protein